MNNKFRVGDWIICGYRVQQIKEMEKDRVTEVTDGFFNLSGNNLTPNCFPLTVATKRIADNIDSAMQRAHKITWANHPDISNYMEERCRMACEASLSGNDKKANEEIERAFKLIAELESQARDVRYKEVDGTRLFHQG